MTELPPSRLLASLPDQFFAALVARAEARRREGRDVINLGQGNPDVPTPPELVDALSRAAARPELQRYTPFRGLGSLKEAAAAWYTRHFGVRLDPSRQIAIAIGAKVALGELPLALVEPGEAVGVPDPGYPDYLSGVGLARARAVPIVLSSQRAYLPDWTTVKEPLRMAYMNYPNNPTGAAATDAAMDEAIAFAERTGTVLVHDWAYGEIRYDGRPAVSLLARPGGTEAGVELVTLSKSHSMAGWRIAFLAGRADVVGHLERLQDHLHCGPFGAIQEAAALALSPAMDAAAQERRAVYEGRRDGWVAACRREGWPMPAPAGSIFAWAAVPGGVSAQRFTDVLLEEADVVVAPGEGFGAQGRGYVRVALTEPRERLEEAAVRIGGVLRQHGWAQVP
jgi:L-glutamine---4-(methylsulfanyl)-2-oxobutanoate aminotransferase